MFVLDSNTLKTSQSKLLLREDTAQLQWLDQALGASKARWKIVIMHHPPHSPTTGAKYFFFVPIGGGRTREFQLDEQLTPILQQARVDVVFTGHNHFYARMLPQDGIRYFVSGGGGRKTYGFEGERVVRRRRRRLLPLHVRAHRRPRPSATAPIDEDGAVRDSGMVGEGRRRGPALVRGRPRRRRELTRSFPSPSPSPWRRARRASAQAGARAGGGAGRVPPLAVGALPCPRWARRCSPAGRTELRVDGDWGNDFGIEDEPGGRPTSELFFVDGEHRTLAAHGAAWLRRRMVGRARASRCTGAAAGRSTP